MPLEKPQGGAARRRDGGQDVDDAEKGLYDNTHRLPVLPPLVHIDEKKPFEIDTGFLSPMSPVHEGITPSSSVPVLSLTAAVPGSDGGPPKQAALPARPKPKISRWILLQLWFNTYRKLFTFVTMLNLTGIIMTALGRFPYAENHLGALVLGNLLCAILFRNELFLQHVST